MNVGRSLFICLIMFSISLSLTGQVKSVNIPVPAASKNWVKTGLTAKEGNLVLFTVEGKVELGKYTKNIPPTGSKNPLVMQYSVDVLAWHGALLCKNGTDYVAAKKTSLSHLTDLFGCPPANVFNNIKVDEDITGNYFISKTQQEISFHVNDKKIDDNTGSFTVTVYVINFVVATDGLFDLAGIITKNNGIASVCFTTDCTPEYEKTQKNYLLQSRLYLNDYSDNTGHYYLNIIRLGKYNMNTETAVSILKQNIYDVFPGACS